MSQLPNATTSKKYMLSEVNTIASLLVLHQQLGAIFDQYVDRDGVQLEEVGSIKLTVAQCGTPTLEVSALEINDPEAFAKMQKELERQRTVKPYIGAHQRASAGFVTGEYGGSYPGSTKPAGKSWRDNGHTAPLTGSDSDDFFQDDDDVREHERVTEPDATREEIEDLNSRLRDQKSDDRIQDAVDRWEDEGGALQPLIGDTPDLGDA